MRNPLGLTIMVWCVNRYEALPYNDLDRWGHESRVRIPLQQPSGMPAGEGRAKTHGIQGCEGYPEVFAFRHSRQHEVKERGTKE